MLWSFDRVFNHRVLWTFFCILSGFIWFTDFPEVLESFIAPQSILAPIKSLVYAVSFWLIVLAYWVGDHGVLSVGHLLRTNEDKALKRYGDKLALFDWFSVIIQGSTLCILAFYCQRNAGYYILAICLLTFINIAWLAIKCKHLDRVTRHKSTPRDLSMAVQICKDAMHNWVVINSMFAVTLIIPALYYIVTDQGNIEDLYFIWVSIAVARSIFDFAFCWKYYNEVVSGHFKAPHLTAA
ncbi:MAG: hypothetical protein KTR29_22960 [Rhodothermaceae bacterium]|nr:hypothetical protein [Rhodothermaceae bacterium]